MATLIDRITATGYDRLLPRDRETPQADMATETFCAFRLPNARDGRRRFRVSGGIGAVNYAPDAGGVLRPVDLTLVTPKGEQWSLGCDEAGYQFRAYDSLSGLPYVGEFRRRGAWARIAPLALYWQGGKARELLAKPVPGLKHAIDADGDVWWPDALGPGIDWGWIRTAGEARKVVRINRAPGKPADPDARMVVAVALAADGATPDAASLRSAWTPILPAGLDIATAGTKLEHSGLICATRNDGQAAYWLRDAEIWDSGEPQRRWRAEVALERRADGLVMLIAVPWAELLTATYPVHIDAVMATEQVEAGADDAYSSGSTYPGYSSTYVTQAYIRAGSTLAAYLTMGVRVTPPLPQGATIDSASASLRAYSAQTPDVSYEWAAEDTDNAGEFGSDHRPGGECYLARTTATAAWDVTEDLTGGSWCTTSDLSAPVQEVVLRPGWSSGNGLVLIAYKATTGYLDGLLYWDAYERGAAYAAKLDVTYTEAAVANPYYYYRMMGVA